MPNGLCSLSVESSRETLVKSSLGGRDSPLASLALISPCQTQSHGEDDRLGV